MNSEHFKVCFCINLVLNKEEEVKLLSVYFLKYQHAQDEKENET